MSEPGKPETYPIVQDKQPEVKQKIGQVQVISSPQISAEIKKVIPQKTIAKENYKEEISAVLADMSDDELLQLAAMFKTDPFMGESPQ